MPSRQLVPAAEEEVWLGNAATVETTDHSTGDDESGESANLKVKELHPDERVG